MWTSQASTSPDSSDPASERLADGNATDSVATGAPYLFNQFNQYAALDITVGTCPIIHKKLQDGTLLRDPAVIISLCASDPATEAAEALSSVVLLLPSRNTRPACDRCCKRCTARRDVSSCPVGGRLRGNGPCGKAHQWLAAGGKVRPPVGGQHATAGLRGPDPALDDHGVGGRGSAHIPLPADAQHIGIPARHERALDL